jgi:hypothetical protein
MLDIAFAVLTIGWLWWFSEVVDILFRGRAEMPVAVAIKEPQRFDLKSLPGGYVVVREMTYGERIMRGGMTGAMKILKETKKTDYVGEMSMETQKLTIWDFANLITEHNLDDADGRRLNFRNEQDVRALASKIGDEIGTYIDQVNSFDEDEEGKSEGASTPVSS